MMIALSATALALLAGSAQAYKDDSYYIAGTGNPNINEKMYWKDAENIFQDLDKFSSLYVEYHNCAWTWTQTTDEENDIDENDYWYMGKIPPMGANVAYSLYGSLYGEEFSGCGQETFINSFYTNTGYGSFASAMNYAGESGFSSYTSGSSTCGGGYGVGCDYDNGFAVHTYNSDECDPQNYSGVKDTLSSLNTQLKGAQCVKIYDRNNYSGYPYGTPLELLAYSHSCFYQDFFSPDGVCPDPYGKLAYYQKQFYQGIQSSKKQDPYEVNKRKALYTEQIEEGKYMSLIGIVLAGLATIMLMFDIVSTCCTASKRISELDKAITAKEIQMEHRRDDFILTKRSHEMDDEEQTEAEDTASEAGYAPMQDDRSVDLEAPVADYTPPVECLESESPAAQPGPEVLVNVMDQDAPVTLYAPPALLATEEAVSTPLPSSFDQDFDVVLPPSMADVTPVPEKETAVAHAEESLATMETTVAAMENLVADKEEEALTSVSVTEEEEEEEAEKKDEETATSRSTEEETEEEQKAPEGAPVETTEETSAEAAREETTENAAPEEATEDAVPEEATEDAAPEEATEEISTEEVTEETAPEETYLEETTEETAEETAEAPSTKEMSAEATQEEAANETPFTEEEELTPEAPLTVDDDPQAEEASIPEIDEVMASREWDSDSETEQETNTERTGEEEACDESAPAAESETEASEETAPQDAVEQSRQQEEIETYSSMPELPEDDEGDQEVPRSQSWFGF